MSLLSSEFVRLATLITGTIVAVIAAYKFVIQRPRLQLIAKHTQDFFHDDLVRTNLQFMLSNRGFRFAEDAYLELHLPDWNFGGPKRKIEIGATVSTVEDGERVVHETYGSHHNPDKEGEEDQSSNGAEANNHLSNSNNSSEDENSQIGTADSVLDLRHDLQTRFLAPGEKNHIFINDILYNGNEFNIFAGEAKIEQFRKYTIEYSVGCRTYGPRKGEITIESRYDDIIISHNHPRFYDAWRDIIVKLLKDFLSFSTSVIHKRTGVDLSKKTVSVDSSILEQEDESDTERHITPVAQIEVSSKVNDLQTVTAKLFLIENTEAGKAIAGSVTFHAQALSPGALWETRAPRRQHRSHLIDYSIEYRESYASSALPVGVVRDNAEESYPVIEAEWEVESSDTDRGNLRGLSKKDCILNKMDGSPGHRPVSVEGKLVNENTVPVTVSVVTKFYTEDGVVLTTPSNRETVPANGMKDFLVNANLGREQEERIDSCDVVLVQGT